MSVLVALTATTYLAEYRNVGLVPAADDGGVLGATVDVGEHANFGWGAAVIGGFHPRGDKPIRLRAARVLNVPDGLVVATIRAHRLHNAPAKPGVISGDLEQKIPGRWQFQPVTEVVFTPGVENEWLIIVTAYATRPGTFATGDLQLDWQAGRRKGTARYPYRIEVEALAPPVRVAGLPAAAGHRSPEGCRR